LDFDEDEALLAIVSVCAFVLIDQISEKLSFDAAKAATPRAVPTLGLSKPLADIVADAIESFHIPPSTEKPQDHMRHAEIVGALAGYLLAVIPGSEVERDPQIDKGSKAQPDLIITAGDKRLLIEVKRLSISRVFVNLKQQYLVQISHYTALTGIKEALIYVHTENTDREVSREEVQFTGVDARVVIMGPRPKKRLAD
jgi:Holliday junction resolvase